MLVKIKTVFSNSKAASLVLLVVLAVGGAYGVKQLTNGSGGGAKCSDALLRKAAPLLELPKRDELKYVAEEVERIKDYRSDVNCLNIVVTFYTHIADPGRARENLDPLRKHYDEQVGFSSLLGGHAKSLNKLIEDVELMEKVEKQIKNNSEYLPNIE